jgi:hypothetical protein
MSTHDPAYSRCFGRGKISPLRFGQGLLTRLSSANAGLPAPNRGRVTWRPPVGRTAGCLDTLAERNQFATKASGSEGGRDQHCSMPAPPLPARAEVWHERAVARRLELSGRIAPAERPKWRAESSQPCPKATSGSVVIDAISSWGSRSGRPARSSHVPGAQPN